MDDLLRLEDLLTEEERLIQQSVAKFADSVIPAMPQAFEEATFSKSIVSQMAELGLLGLLLPEVYGGSSATYMAYGLACQELERADSSLRSFMSVQNSLCIFPIFAFGSESQKQHWLPLLSSGKTIGCFGLTEPDSGSDPAGMRTTAKKSGNDWILSGEKTWITNAPIADIGIIWAKTEDGIMGFLVDIHANGVTRQEISHKMSLRASSTGMLAFNDVKLDAKALLPGSANLGLKAPLQCLSQARYGISWGVIGAARACFDIARDYTCNREQFKKPLASFQLIQSSLAEMYSEILKAQCLNMRIGQLKDKSQDNADMISLAKRNACRVALNIARESRNLLGGNGISLEYHIIRHMLNLEAVFTYEGTDNIHTLILGRHVTGINAFA